MKRISLISNSSIQYHKFEAEINLDFAKSNKVYFHQPFDSNILDFTFDPLFKTVINDTERYYRKQELVERDFIVNNRLKDDVDINACHPVTDFYETNNLKKALKHFKKKWILRDRRGCRLLSDVAGADRVRERLLSLRVDGVIGKPFPRTHLGHAVAVHIPLPDPGKEGLRPQGLDSLLANAAAHPGVEPRGAAGRNPRRLVCQRRISCCKPHALRLSSGSRLSRSLFRSRRFGGRSGGGFLS